jgi:hypothetical protein
MGEWDEDEEVDDEELADMVRRARARIAASHVGAMHAMFDVVADAEACLEGKPHIMSRDDVVRTLSGFVNF